MPIKGLYIISYIFKRCKMNSKYITSAKIFGSLVALYQANSIYNYGKFYDKVMYYGFREKNPFIDNIEYMRKKKYI